ncbi:MAG: hypothetical protein MJA31_07480, partial [Clostridia bacterium]|nr:hypothetical protein [Clostridia bacterium]
MKKTLSFLLITILMMSVFGLTAFADDGCTTYPYITLADSADFTIVTQGLANYKTVKVQGLNASWTKVDFTATEKDYITWTTSNGSNVRFLDGFNLKTSLSGTDTATIVVFATATADATVTITYDTPDDDPVSVTSYIYAEGTSTTSSVSNIDVVVDASGAANDFTSPGLNVPLFNLLDEGIVTDDDDVLHQAPSALHALLYALEIYHSTETTSTNINNFDWNWVKANVVIESEGSFVKKIES